MRDTRAAPRERAAGERERRAAHENAASAAGDHDEPAQAPRAQSGERPAHEGELTPTTSASISSRWRIRGADGGEHESAIEQNAERRQARAKIAKPARRAMRCRARRRTAARARAGRRGRRRIAREVILELEADPATAASRHARRRAAPGRARRSREDSLHRLREDAPVAAALAERCSAAARELVDPRRRPLAVSHELASSPSASSRWSAG